MGSDGRAWGQEHSKKPNAKVNVNSVTAYEILKAAERKVNNERDTSCSIIARTMYPKHRKAKETDSLPEEVAVIRTCCTSCLTPRRKRLEAFFKNQPRP